MLQEIGWCQGLSLCFPGISKGPEWGQTLPPTVPSLELPLLLFLIIRLLGPWETPPTPSILYFKIPLCHTFLGLREWRERRDIQELDLCLPLTSSLSLPPTYQLYSLMASHECFTQVFPLFIYYFQLWGLSRIRFGGGGWHSKLNVSHSSRMRSSLFMF